MVKHEYVIEGVGETREVFISGRPLSPRRSQGVMKHSPDGFNWGYSGSGPAQLALALMLAFCEHKQTAIGLYQAFKFEVVATWPMGKDFSYPCAKVHEWINEKLKEESHA